MSQTGKILHNPERQQVGRDSWLEAHQLGQREQVQERAAETDSDRRILLVADEVNCTNCTEALTKGFRVSQEILQKNTVLAGNPASSSIGCWLGPKLRALLAEDRVASG